VRSSLDFLERLRWIWLFGCPHFLFWGWGPWGCCSPSSSLATTFDTRLLGLTVLREGKAMLILTAIVTVLLFMYLLAALLRPEWF
jgi:K+-transporting ATPase KdpF subunit